MRYFELAGGSEPDTNQSKPLKVLFATSMRDIMKYDQNGRMVKTRDGDEGYMQGVIEALAQSINENRDNIARCINIVGIVYDDVAHQRDTGGTFHIDPEKNQAWAYPLDLVMENTGETLGEITQNLPSDFRFLPSDDVQGRAYGKAQFEERLVQIMDEKGADIIISDHLIMQLVNVIRPEVYGLLGRVLNIHPAITHKDHPHKLRGLTPTQDAIDRANGEKRGVDNAFTKVEPYFFTGSTLHFVDAEIDAGAVICDKEGTPVYPDDEPQWLRFRNYQKAKIPVFLQGLQHYYRTMYTKITNTRPNTLITKPQHVPTQSTQQ